MIDGRKVLGIGCMLAATAVGQAKASGARRPGLTFPLTPAGEKLLASCSGMLSTLRAEFARQGKQEAKPVAELLTDDDLMNQGVTAGGAKAGMYALTARGDPERAPAPLAHTEQRERADGHRAAVHHRQVVALVAWGDQSK